MKMTCNTFKIIQRLLFFQFLSSLSILLFEISKVMRIANICFLRVFVWRIGRDVMMDGDNKLYNILVFIND